jgi:hypothetical protein
MAEKKLAHAGTTFATIQGCGGFVKPEDKPRVSFDYFLRPPKTCMTAMAVMSIKYKILPKYP